MAFEFKPEYAKRVIFYMVKMAEADDLFTDNEIQFLYDIADQNEIDPRKIFTGDKGVKPKDEVDRATMLYYLVFMMKIDGKITTDEANFLRKTGLELGFRPTMVEEFLQIAIAKIKDKIPPSDLLSIIKKYHN